MTDSYDIEKSWIPDVEDKIVSGRIFNMRKQMSTSHIVRIVKKIERNKIFCI